MNEKEFNNELESILNELNSGNLTPSQAFDIISQFQDSLDRESIYFNRIMDETIDGKVSIMPGYVIKRAFDVNDLEPEAAEAINNMKDFDYFVYDENSIEPIESKDVSSFINKIQF